MLESATEPIKRAARRRSEAVVTHLLEDAGIEVGGSAPHDIQVHDPRFFTRVLRDGSLGLGESYMDGWWDAEALDQTIYKMLAGRLNHRVKSHLASAALALQAKVLNRQNAHRAPEVGRRHYDIGNDLYQRMLDRHLAYTCGYWRNATSLDEAQEAKLDLVCRKIGLPESEGMRVLELGCGWGGFARFAAERYGARVTGYTISEKQAELGRELCAGLPVEIHLDDYRNASGTYDAVISIGIMEHVGPRNYRAYMEVVDRCLKEDGVGFVHTIAGNHSTDFGEPWLDRYIFPNAVLPSMAQLGKAMEELFVPEDLHNIGPDYDPTLMAWWERFEAAWPELRDRYSDRFYRMWRYYLLSCAGTFRARRTQLYQLVFTRPPTSQPDCRAV